MTSSKSSAVVLLASLFLSGCWRAKDSSVKPETLAPFERADKTPSLTGGGAGDGVGNGGGLAEKHLIYAFYTLADDLGSCLGSSLCRLNEGDAVVVRRILRALRSGQETIEGIHFRSEKQTPGFFWLKGRPKTALTGSNPGDVVYINVDQIYLPTDEQTHRPLTILESTALLVHELAHHQGIGSSDEEIRRLDLLTAEIVHYLKSPGAGRLPGALDAGLGAQWTEALQCVPSRKNKVAPYAWLKVRFRTYEGRVTYSMSLGESLLPSDPIVHVPVRITQRGTTIEIVTKHPVDDGFPSLSIGTERKSPPERWGFVAEPAAVADQTYAARLNTSESEFSLWTCTFDRQLLKKQTPFWALFFR